MPPMKTGAPGAVVDNHLYEEESKSSKRADVFEDDGSWTQYDDNDDEDLRSIPKEKMRTQPDANVKNRGNLSEQQQIIAETVYSEDNYDSDSDDDEYSSDSDNGDDENDYGMEFDDHTSSGLCKELDSVDTSVDGNTKNGIMYSSSEAQLAQGKGKTENRIADAQFDLLVKDSDAKERKEATENKREDYAPSEHKHSSWDSKCESEGKYYERKDCKESGYKNSEDNSRGSDTHLEAEPKDYHGVQEAKGTDSEENTAIFVQNDNPSRETKNSNGNIDTNGGALSSCEQEEMHYDKSTKPDESRGLGKNDNESSQSNTTVESTKKLTGYPLKLINQPEDSKDNNADCPQKKTQPIVSSPAPSSFPNQMASPKSKENITMSPQTYKTMAKNTKIRVSRFNKKLNRKGERYAMLRGTLLGTRHLLFCDDQGKCNIFAKALYMCASKNKNVLTRRRTVLHETEVKEATANTVQWEQSDFFVELTNNEKDRKHPNIFGDLLLAVYCLHSVTKQRHFIGQCIIHIPRLCKRQSTQEVGEWMPLRRRNASPIDSGAELHLKAEVILPQGMDTPTKKTIPVQKKEHSVTRKRSKVVMKPSSKETICMEVLERHRRTSRAKREQAQQKIEMENKRLEERLNKITGCQKNFYYTSAPESGPQRIANELKYESYGSASMNIEYTNNEPSKSELNTINLDYANNESSQNGLNTNNIEADSDLSRIKRVGKRVEKLFASTLDAEQQRIQKSKELLRLLNENIETLKSSQQSDDNREILDHFDSFSTSEPDRVINPGKMEQLIQNLIVQHESLNEEIEETKKTKESLESDIEFEESKLEIIKSLEDNSKSNRSLLAQDKLDNLRNEVETLRYEANHTGYHFVETCENEVEALREEIRLLEEKAHIKREKLEDVRLECKQAQEIFDKTL